MDPACENPAAARAGKAQMGLHDRRGTADLIARESAPAAPGEGLMDRLLNLVALGLVHWPARVGKPVESAYSGPCPGDDGGGFDVAARPAAPPIHDDTGQDYRGRAAPIWRRPEFESLPYLSKRTLRNEERSESWSGP